MKMMIYLLLGLTRASLFDVKAEDSHLAVYVSLYGTNIVNVKPSDVPRWAYMGTNLCLRLYGEQGILTNQFTVNEQLGYCVIPITPPGTNEVFYRHFPRNQAFEFHLFDGLGREIVKTEQGRANSQPVHAPESKNDAAKLAECNAPFGAFKLFRPTEMFVITNKGIYEMEVSLRVWAKVSDGGPNNDGISYFVKSLGTNAHFGVVALQPVRVKIIKE